MLLPVPSPGPGTPQGALTHHRTHEYYGALA
jgi:hypothetical protein